LILSSIAKQFDVRGDDSQLLLELLKSNLQEKHLLLLLDNFEQVIAAAPTVTQILAVIPNLKVLVTSRAPLNLRGEHAFRVPPLKLPERTQVWSLERLGQYESIQLFIERAQAVRADFALTADNALALAEICHRLDGLPLAIELAAARIKLLPPQSLLTRLDHRLKLLTGGAQDLPHRQQTLRNTLDWSYSLLAEEEQILFARLAVFVGGFTLETAVAICSADGCLDVFEGVTSLLNNSLLMPQTTCSDQPRFRMLETIREYALERLAERDQMETLRQQHAHYFARWVAEFGLGSYPGTGYWLDLIEEEHDNLRAVLNWSLADLDQAELGAGMVGILYWFWYQRGYISEGRDWCRQLMTFTPEMGRTVGRASLLLGSGSLALMQGDLKRAAPRLAESAALWRELQDEKRLALALTACGVLALNQGDLTTAEHNFEEGLAIGRQLDHRWFIAASLLNLGGMAVAQGDYAAAQVRLAEAAVVAKTSDDDWLAASILNNLGEIARVQGDYEQARCSYSESQALLRKTGHKPDVARSLHNLGYVVQHQGNYDQAQAYFQESLAMFRELGNKRGIAECLAGLAGLAVGQGQPQGAARLLGAAQTQLTASGASWWPADLVEYERNLATIQTALNQEIFAAAWKEGQVMSLEQAIAYALDNKETLLKSGSRGFPKDSPT
jgi:predicted ATPase/Tfp pilus assembly protein PilF